MKYRDVAWAVLASTLFVLGLLLGRHEPVSQDSVVLYDRAHDKCWLVAIDGNNMRGKNVPCPDGR